jgi:hypothetical protein
VHEPVEQRRGQRGVTEDLAPATELEVRGERHRAALVQTPLALFALGPISAGEGVQGSSKQLDAALAKLPWLSSVAMEVFVGKYDPAKLGFKDKMIAALPASPRHGEPAHDERDWEAIRRWARDVSDWRRHAAEPVRPESAWVAWHSPAASRSADLVGETVRISGIRASRAQSSDSSW